MNQPLPYGGFDWLNKQQINELDLESVSENSSIGYFLEVDLEYPDELHDLHNDYPLAPEKLEISSDMLSKYCSDIADKYRIKVGGVSRLVPNLRDKKKCCSLQKSSVVFVIRNEEYTEFNSEKRKEAVSSFKKNFFKLLTNRIYGKCMENLRKRINVKLINNSKDYTRYVSKPNFISQKIFSKNFVAVHQIKSVLTLNKPIYMRFSSLELSKLLMYKFHYESVKNKFDAKLLFIDTDSLVYEIRGKDVYEMSHSGKHLFDFSEYPVNTRFYHPANKKVLGKMKHEFKGQKKQRMCWIEK